MLDRKSRGVKQQIVNLQPPHVRPIVREKAGHETQFGATLTVSMVDG